MSYSQLISTYLGVGTLAARPASPNVASGVAAFYYGTDTGLLYAWDGSTWHTITAGASTLAADTKTRTSGDLSVTSTSFATLDAALNITLTTGAHRCLVGWTLMCTNSVDGNPGVDVAVDGTRQGQTYGLVFAEPGTVGNNQNLSGTYLTDVLSAASHTFALQFRTTGGTATVFASTTVAPVVFWVLEQNA